MLKEIANLMREGVLEEQAGGRTVSLRSAAPYTPTRWESGYFVKAKWVTDHPYRKYRSIVAKASSRLSMTTSLSSSTIAQPTFKTS